MATKELILSKTGEMNMGGYFSTKTAQLHYDGTYYRTSFRSDSTDECWDTLEEAEKRYERMAAQII
jgi:hypothetical protein